MRFRVNNYRLEFRFGVWVSGFGLFSVRAHVRVHVRVRVRVRGSCSCSGSSVGSGVGSGPGSARVTGGFGVFVRVMGQGDV